jgi:hypothetical protein
VRALTVLIRTDPKTQDLIENDAAMAALSELALSEIESVRMAVEQLLKEIGLEVG